MERPYTVKFNTPVGKGNPANTDLLIEVGDNLTLIKKLATGNYADEVVVVTYVSNDGMTVGWAASENINPEEVVSYAPDHRREDLYCS